MKSIWTICKASIKWEKKRTKKNRWFWKNTNTKISFFVCFWCWHIIIIIPRLPSIYPSILVGVNGNKWRPYFHLQFYMYTIDKRKLQKHLFVLDEKNTHTPTLTIHVLWRNRLTVSSFVCYCVVLLERESLISSLFYLSISVAHFSTKNKRKNHKISMLKISFAIENRKRKRMGRFFHFATFTHTMCVRVILCMVVPVSLQ